MRVRLWPFVSFIFALLLALVVLFAWSVARKLKQIDARASLAHVLYQRADDAITNIRADVYRAALLSREASSNAVAAQNEIPRLRDASEADLRALFHLLGPAQRKNLEALERELTSYWSLPVSAGESQQRNAVLGLAEQIDALNEASIRQQENEIREDRLALGRYALNAALLLITLCIAIALVAITYLARLENRSDAAKQRAEQAEDELRRLSQQLVRAQEEERKTIARELHDEVGQLLTGLRFELGALSKRDTDPGFQERINSIKRLAEDSLRAVRHISLLLRPPMLDDLGLAPALRWQSKELSQRIGLPISLDVEGNLELLPESHRICLYRVIQEALTNCAKHAAPRHIAVTIQQGGGFVIASVRDDGRGFDEKNIQSHGLGLAGMKERVATLHGTLSVFSRPGEGTELLMKLPLPGIPEMQPETA